MSEMEMPRPAETEAPNESHTNEFDPNYNAGDHQVTGTQAVYSFASPQYWEKGWRCPLPLNPRSKKDGLPAGFSGTNGVDTSYADVLEFCELRVVDANITLRLPDDGDTPLIGIDVDDYDGKNGAVTLAEAERRWGALPAGPRSTSRDDGINGIRIFRVPPSLEFDTLLKFPELRLGDIEIIQKKHRHIVAWPSIHPEARVYQWRDHNNRIIEIPNVTDFPELPAEWIEGLGGKPKGQCHGAGTHLEPAQIDQIIDDAMTSGRPSARVGYRLSDAVEALKGSSRFDNTRTHVAALLRLGRNGEPGVKAALDTLRGAYVATLGPVRGGGAKEALKEFNRLITNPGMARLLNEPGHDDWIKNLAPNTPTAACTDDKSDTPADLISTVEQAAEQAMEYLIADRLKRLRIEGEAKRRLASEQRGELTLPAFVALDALLAEPRTETRYRIDQVAPLGARVMLSAQYKAGKSHMGLNLARALVDGTPFLDAFTVTSRATKVVVIDDELSQNMMLAWWERQQVTNAAAIVPISLRGSVGEFNLLDPEIRDKWAQQLKAIGCDYLILDCLRPILDALGLDENHDAGKFLVAFDALLTEAVVGDAAVIHHMGHNSERARGDSRLLDWPDAIWKLVRQDEDPASARFFSAYGRDVDIPEGQIGYDPDTGRMTFDSDTNRRAAKQTQAKTAKIDAARSAIVEFLAERARGGEKPPSKNQTETSSHIAFDKHPQKVRREAFNALIADNILRVEKDERGAERLVIAHPCLGCQEPLEWGLDYHPRCGQDTTATQLGRPRQDLGNLSAAEPDLGGEAVRQLGNPLGAVPSAEPTEYQEAEGQKTFLGKTLAEPERSNGLAPLELQVEVPCASPSAQPKACECGNQLITPQALGSGKCKPCRGENS